MSAEGFAIYIFVGMVLAFWAVANGAGRWMTSTSRAKGLILAAFAGCVIAFVGAGVAAKLHYLVIVAGQDDAFRAANPENSFGPAFLSGVLMLVASPFVALKFGAPSKASSDIE
ncbi:MAG: hypothetical protein AB8B51_12295 [Sedimentitalea sp.]